MLGWQGVRPVLTWARRRLLVSLVAKPWALDMEPQSGAIYISKIRVLCQYKYAVYMYILCICVYEYNTYIYTYIYIYKHVYVYVIYVTAPEGKKQRLEDPSRIDTNNLHLRKCRNIHTGLPRGSNIAPLLVNSNP